MRLSSDEIVRMVSLGKLARGLYPGPTAMKSLGAEGLAWQSIDNDQQFGITFEGKNELFRLASREAEVEFEPAPDAVASSDQVPGVEGKTDEILSTLADDNYASGSLECTSKDLVDAYQVVAHSNGPNWGPGTKPKIKI
ncbi:hypothetical protein [Xanthomonas sp. 4461]|uniref:hypothetical protein n=1 Tax=Xanthomonas sp. 4461 TaxID=3035313 RepID=UPI002166F109|nr:hypothetical protein [Xanthomonas sp. 4461]MCS3807848.1 hypothetical protein [Xanthomonas sp. 4461]